MMIALRSLLILLMTVCSVVARGAAIGTWTSYLAYGDITQIQPAGKRVYVLSSKGLFSYNTSDQSVETYDKMNTLNDCNISHIAWCQAAKRLIIIYENQNIDLLDEQGKVVNISNYYSKSMMVDKTINEVSVYGSFAYLSTNFGILKINVADAEISATYNLGRKINSTAEYKGFIYASCESQGILAGNMKDNLLDKSFWKEESDFQTKHLAVIDNQLFAFVPGTVYSRTSSGWQFAYNCHFSFLTQSGGQIILGTDQYTWIFTSASSPKLISKGLSGIKTIVYDNANKCYWTNQSDGKLCSMTIEEDTFIPQLTDINPDGPKYNYFGAMLYANNTLYTCGGGYDSFAELFRPAIVQTFADDEWTVYQDDMGETVGNSMQDITCIDFDPKDKNHVFAGGRAGIYEYLNGRFVRHYNPNNSSLMYSTPDNSPNYILTLGIKFDKQGNLWCLNSLAENASLLELKTYGTWESHHHKTFMDDNGRSLANMKCLILDSRGFFWFVNNHWSLPSFYCYDPASDAINHYDTFVNEDGSTINPNGVKCIAEDKDGNMWIGTNVGPLMLPSNDISKGSNAVLQQIKVPRNDGTNFADYLLSGVEITCITIDGGNRKWFGTNGNGAYLISSDNMTQVHHFLSSNSMLLSDNVESIAINDQTGEVFFGTDNGLCSYMSDATATNEDMNKDNVYAYPNPVKPGYMGLITITGLSMNADVKIVTANGAVVAEGVSNGGSFTWNGCDKNGKRVASGVYMVLTATSEGKKGTVCKIAIVN